MTLTARAAALLQAAAAGCVDLADAHTLARDWLAATGGAAALAVLTGGEFEAARIVERCELVLDAVGDEAEGDKHAPEEPSAAGGASEAPAGRALRLYSDRWRRSQGVAQRMSSQSALSAGQLGWHGRTHNVTMSADNSHIEPAGMAI